MSDLIDREREFVNKVVDWYRTHEPESEIETEWMMSQLHLGRTRLFHFKKSLVAKGIIRSGKGYRLTDTAIIDISQLQSTVRITAPVHLPLLGQVRAGRTKQDDLRAYLIDPKSEAAETRAIPYSEDNSDVYLLEVVGNSMLHVSINPGDYVIVKPFARDARPKQGQLIVAKYLLPANEQEAGEAGDFYNDLLEGPTVKFYTYNPGRYRPHRLTSHREASLSHTIIDTRDIDAIGQVIGVYRNLTS